MKEQYEDTCSYKCNIPSDPSMDFHIVVGTGRYTTSTTNMYNTYLEDAGECRWESGPNKGDPENQ
jgi:hypothetical protein